jgi:hypothetical protein
MANDVSQRIEEALEKLVSITEKSVNLRKDHKQNIILSVSSLRKEISTMKMQLKNVEDERKKLIVEVRNIKEANPREDTQTTRKVAPSLDHTQKNTRSEVQQVAPADDERKLFSEVVQKKATNVTG